jgi:hypothetical protein
LKLTKDKLQACAELMEIVLEESNLEIFLAGTKTQEAEPVNEFVGQKLPLNDLSGNKLGKVFFFSVIDMKDKSYQIAYTIKSECHLDEKALLESETNLPEIKAIYTDAVMATLAMMEKSPQGVITLKDLEEFIAQIPIGV